MPGNHVFLTVDALRESLRCRIALVGLKPLHGAENRPCKDESPEAHDVPEEPILRTDAEQSGQAKGRDAARPFSKKRFLLIITFGCFKGMTMALT